MDTATTTETFVAGWTWLKGKEGSGFDGFINTTVFHAIDERGQMACDVFSFGGPLCEKPTEGSRLCVHCVDVVKANPAGMVRTLAHYGR